MQYRPIHYSIAIVELIGGVKSVSRHEEATAGGVSFVRQGDPFGKHNLAIGPT